MAIEREKFLEILRDSYSAYYNVVDTDAPADIPLAFRADYFSRSEKYWLNKKNVIWGNETNEYAYIFSAPEFTKELIEKCTDFALDDGLPRVKPHKEHQYTNVKVVFIADRLDEKEVKPLTKKEFSKSYRFSLHGFTNLLSGAVDLETQRTYTNRAGHSLEPFFNKLFAAREEKT